MCSTFDTPPFSFFNCVHFCTQYRYCTPACALHPLHNPPHGRALGPPHRNLPPPHVRHTRAHCMFSAIPRGRAFASPARTAPGLASAEIHHASPIAKTLLLPPYMGRRHSRRIYSTSATPALMASATFWKAAAMDAASVLDKHRGAAGIGDSFEECVARLDVDVVSDGDQREMMPRMRLSTLGISRRSSLFDLLSAPSVSATSHLGKVGSAASCSSRSRAPLRTAE